MPSQERVEEGQAKKKQKNAKPRKNRIMSSRERLEECQANLLRVLKNAKPRKSKKKAKPRKSRRMPSQERVEECQVN